MSALWAIPLEADPLLGLQIVGLCGDYAFALCWMQATIFFQAFPRELRQVTGLPTLASSQLKIARSDALHLFGQEIVVRDALVEGKRSRSG